MIHDQRPPVYSGTILPPDTVAWPTTFRRARRARSQGQAALSPTPSNTTPDRHSLPGSHGQRPWFWQLIKHAYPVGSTPPNGLCCRAVAKPDGADCLCVAGSPCRSAGKPTSVCVETGTECFKPRRRREIRPNHFVSLHLCDSRMKRPQAPASVPEVFEKLLAMKDQAGAGLPFGLINCGSGACAGGFSFTGLPSESSDAGFGLAVIGWFLMTASISQLSRDSRSSSASASRIRHSRFYSRISQARV